MITAVVTAPLPQGFTYEKYAANVSKIADGFRTVPGLIRKNFLYSEEQRIGGGIYLWENQAAAEACYAGIWRDNFRNIFGVDPQIDFYQTPIVVDNRVGEIVSVAV
jgi:hypothetical protein